MAWPCASSARRPERSFRKTGAHRNWEQIQERNPIVRRALGGRAGRFLETAQPPETSEERNHAQAIGLAKRRDDSRRRVADDRRFHGVGSPHRLIGELLRQGRKDLTVIGNDAARPGVGIGRLVDAKAIKRMVTRTSAPTPNRAPNDAGETIVELCRKDAGPSAFGGRLRSGRVLTTTGIGPSPRG